MPSYRKAGLGGVARCLPGIYKVLSSSLSALGKLGKSLLFTVDRLSSTQPTEFDVCLCGNTGKHP